ncbi:MAG: BamA/OMP85 family outer membrane protein [bacterium]
MLLIRSDSAMKRIARILILSGFLLVSIHAECRERIQRPLIKDVKLTGVEAFSEKKIKSLMRTRKSGFLRKKYLRESSLETDLLAVAEFYKSRGFLDVNVEVEEIRFDSERKNVWMTIRVDEGKRIDTNSIEFVGATHISEDELRKIISVKVGQPVSLISINRDKYAIYSKYADIGYVYASISHDLLRQDKKAILRYVISEGIAATIDTIRVSGNNRTSSKIVIREVDLKPGMLFSRSKMLNSVQNLYNTGLFKDVEIEPVASRLDSTRVSLSVRVMERKMREASVAIGYGTMDEARLTVGWSNRNLWNGGMEVQMRGIVASKDFDRGLTRERGEVSLTQRWLLGQRLAGGVAVYAQRSIEDYQEVPGGEYKLLRIGGDLSVRKDISRFSKIILTYLHEFVDVSDPSWGVEESEDLRLQIGQEVNRSAALFIERDSRVPFFDPYGGSLSRLMIRRAGGLFGGDNSYTKATVGWTDYRRIGRENVLAVGIRIGFAEAFGDSRSKGVPEYERFSAGGSSTIRGYNESEFGPGDFLLIGNLELRFPIFWKIRGVTFVDFGNSWDSIKDVEIDDFRIDVDPAEYSKSRRTDVKYTIGVGIGVATPIGPARVDYGYKLKRAVFEDGSKENPGMIHILVGHAF